MLFIYFCVMTAGSNSFLVPVSIFVTFHSFSFFITVQNHVESYYCCYNILVKHISFSWFPWTAFQLIALYITVKTVTLRKFTFLSHLSLSVATGSARTRLNWINHFGCASLVKCIGLTHVIQKLLVQYYTALMWNDEKIGEKERFPHLDKNPLVEKLTIVLKRFFFQRISQIRKLHPETCCLLT